MPISPIPSSLTERLSLDDTGQLAQNLVTQETHALSRRLLKNDGFVLPLKGPFYNEGLSITQTLPNGVVRALVKCKDYSPVFQLSDVSSNENPVYGGIGIHDTDLEGTLQISYQALGGSWRFNQSLIRRYLRSAVYLPSVAILELVGLYPTGPSDRYMDLSSFQATAAAMQTHAVIELSIRTRPFGADAVQLLCPVDNSPGPTLPGLLEVVSLNGFTEYVA